MAKQNHSMQRKAYHAARSFLRQWRGGVVESERGVGSVKRSGIKVAFIYGEKRTATGADHINRLMAVALAKKGARVRGFYPRVQLRGAPSHLKGITNILFFHSLLEHKNEILKYDVIQGTTYTPLPFLTFDTPVVSHFGSTTRGFLNNTPSTAKLAARDRALYRALYKLGILSELDFKTFRPLEDSADIEELVALQANACIATSQKVKEELITAGVDPERVHVIHNAIEDYWFESPPPTPTTPHLVFLGRLGGDVFTLKLKGFDRLVTLYSAFPKIPKTTICMTVNKPLKEWIKVSFPQHYMFVNLRRDLIPNVLKPRFGSVQLLTSRYEGFS
ncbi:MAG: glycosyltransferase, partial [Candidatus Adlerbacteria bacterium]|nr:glycosyltransferase [Candidatus Adlerbacteria bacterium]